MVSDREKKNDDIIGLVGYPSRRFKRCAPGQLFAGPASTSIDEVPAIFRASSIASRCISDQNILLQTPNAMRPKSFLPARLVDKDRRP